MNRRGFFRSLGIAALGAAARVYAPGALDAPEPVVRSGVSLHPDSEQLQTDLAVFGCAVVGADGRRVHPLKLGSDPYQKIIARWQSIEGDSYGESTLKSLLEARE